MSEETQKTIKEAEEFFHIVEEGSETFQSIPDSNLQKKIKKVQEDAAEVVKHIKERTEPEHDS